MKQHKHAGLLAVVLILALLLPVFSGIVLASGTTPLPLTPVDASMLSADAIVGTDRTKVPAEESQYAPTDTVRIFVALSQPSAVERGYSTKGVQSNKQAMAYMQSLKQTQNELAKQIVANVITNGTFHLRSNLTMVANAFTATVQYGDLDKLESYLSDTYGDEVMGVYLVPRYEIMENETAEPNTLTATGMVGAQTAWSLGFSGAGSRIAIIDTGLDSDHPSFDADAFRYSLELTAIENSKKVSDYNLLDKTTLAQVLPGLHAYEIWAKQGNTLCADDVYHNEKLAFAFNYIDENLDITHDNDTQGDHGTHVSGIATANRYVKQVADNGAVAFVPQENGVVGVAPDAQILTMKVFGKGGGAYADDYMLAIEDAIALDCDAVNLSIGASVPGNSYAGVAYIDTIMDNLANMDTVVTFSAGNGGYWSQNSYADGQGLNYAEDVSMQTGGASGSYTNAFTVAAAVNTSVTGVGGIFSGVKLVVNDGGSGQNRPWATLDTTADASGRELEYVFLGDPNDEADEDKYGAPAAYDGLDVAGKIVFVSRGGQTFAEKHVAAEQAGAAACIIYNNIPGTFNMTLSGSTATIPCACIAQRDAAAIFAVSATGTARITKNILTMDNPDGYTMGDFSSWGTTGNLAIKPEITAPGGNIYSTVNGGYGINSGTSMSAPSVAGQSAVVAQYVRENGLAGKTGLSQRALVQSLLMSTATPLTDPESELPYSVRQQGAGLANVAKALRTPAYLLMDGGADGKVKAELGDDAAQVGSYSFSFFVQNLTGQELTYYSEVQTLTPKIVRIDGSQYMSTHETALHPTVTVVADNADYLYDFNADGKVDRDDAQRLSDYVAGLSDLTEEQRSTADLNEDGAVDSADIYLLLRKLVGGSADTASAKIPVDANGSTRLSVTITLSEEDRQYFADHTPNGGYVEGYVRLFGACDLTVPFLAFYGNFTDASMFDRTELVEHFYGLDPDNSYISSDNQVNMLTQRLSGSSTAYVFGFNLYADEDNFSHEQNYVLSAINGNSLYQACPSMIRNAAQMKTSITNAETGEVYWQTFTAPTAAYYQSSSNTWQGTTSRVKLGSNSTGWLGTDAAGNPLPDGTVVNVTCTAAPELYTGVDAQGQRFLREDALGRGASWTTTVTIDNTIPTIHSVHYEKSLFGGSDYLTVEAEDTRNLAAVILFDSTGKTALTRTGVVQSAMGECSTARLSLDGIEGEKFVVAAVDYAGNIKSVGVSLDGTGDPDIEDPDNQPDNNVYAAVQGNDGTLMWATVDLSDATATKVSGLATPLENAAYYGGNIYGNVGGALYELDGKTLQVQNSTQLSSTYNFSDITVAPTLDRFVLAGGQRLCLMPVGSTNVNYFNLASLLEGDTLTGVAYMFTKDYKGVPTDYIGAVSSSGRFYTFLIYTTSTGFGLSYSTYGSTGVSASETGHAQGLLYNRNDGDLYYTVGATVYRIGLKKNEDGASTADCRRIGAIANAKMASAMLNRYDGVNDAPADTAAWSEQPTQDAEILCVPDSLR